MKKTLLVLLLLAATSVVMAADTTNVTAVINGKRVQFRPDIGDQIAQKSVALLASCAYVNAKPKWGAGGSEPKSIEDAQKQSHLHLVFSSPVKVEVPVEKATVQVREIVVSLPLATAGIWVRTKDGVMYFAMFDGTARSGLQKLLDDAQKP